MTEPDTLKPFPFMDARHAVTLAQAVLLLTSIPRDAFVEASTEADNADEIQWIIDNPTGSLFVYRRVLARMSELRELLSAVPTEPDK